MDKEGTVLGHKVSQKGIEVIKKLPPPICVKGIQSFLRYAGFYRCFMKDFSTVAHPTCKFLENEVKIVFHEACLKVFECLKKTCIETCNHRFKVKVHKNHASLRYLIAKKHAKPRLIR